MALVLFPAVDIITPDGRLLMPHATETPTTSGVEETAI
jgi:hypothetical protein